jgi:hypothetical protein
MRVIVGFSTPAGITLSCLIWGEIAHKVRQKRFRLCGRDISLGIAKQAANPRRSTVAENNY